MIRDLQSIASQLSESDLQELIRIKKLDDKKTMSLRKKRDKLAAEVAKLDAQIDKLMGSPAPRQTRKAKSAGEEDRPAARTGRKPGRKKRSSRVSLSGAVRQVLENAGTPLKASQVVDALPDAGIKVKSVPDMRKRISVILASQKNYFESVERGLYRLRS